ncbi:MAG: hypothetical protein A2Z20_09205 [Bdellovibrionales bacterium RBG_16_40_8]|nr:MAG: hypothetical protein A2Z20_09205 [Bdellovibrionales bacterium RBG_16_40_8]
MFEQNFAFKIIFFIVVLVVFAVVKNYWPMSRAQRDRLMMAKSLLGANQAMLLDVRELSELSMSGLAESAQHFAFSEFKANPDNLLKKFGISSSTTVFIYCASGIRAQKVVAWLKQKNITAESLGGLKDLKNDFTIVRKK